MRRVALGTLAAGIVLVVPGIAFAGEVLIPKNAPPFPNTPAVFRAFSNETNDLTVTGGNGFVFVDSLALLTAGPGCTLLPNGSGSCPTVRVVEAYLKDEDDNAHVTISGTGRVWAGSGDDTVVADSFSAATFVYGQGGDDEISAGGEGGQLADGGSGDDIVHAGGFAGSGTGLGGSGDDVIYYRTFLGGGLATLDGGEGDDTIVTQPAGGTAAGGVGDDIIVIDGQVPQMGGGGFTVTGGNGADTIVGGAFADTIDAGAGRDYVDVDGGGADTVTCGSGTDVVRHDGTDTIAADCEILIGP